MKAAIVVVVALLCSGSTIFAQSKEEGATSRSPIHERYGHRDVAEPFSALFGGQVDLVPSDKLSTNRIDIASPELGGQVLWSKKWATTIIQAQWLPNPEDVDLFGFRRGADGHDVIRWSWTTNGMRFVCSSTASRFIVAIESERLLNPKAPVTADQATTNIAAAVRRFIKESGAVLSIEMVRIQQQGTGYEGRQKESVVTADNWWGTLNWWTDGNTVILSFAKTDARLPILPSPRADWFTSLNTNQFSPSQASVVPGR